MKSWTDSFPRFLLGSLALAALAALSAGFGCHRPSAPAPSVAPPSRVPVAPAPTQPSASNQPATSNAPATPQPSQSQAFATGDILVARSDGQVERHSPDGALVRTLTGASGAEAAGMAFDAAGALYVTGFGAAPVQKFDATGAPIGDFGSGYDRHPCDIVFDRSGKAYVSQADGGRAILTFDAAGNPLGRLFAPSASGGIDLAADQRTLFYASADHTVKRYDVTQQAPLPDFGPTLPGPAVYAVRLLSDGGLLAAVGDGIVWLDPSGQQIQMVKTPEEHSWVAVSPAADGKSFWAADRDSGRVCKFDLTTGAPLFDFHLSQGAHPSGLTVKDEFRAALTTAESAAAPTNTLANPSTASPNSSATGANPAIATNPSTPGPNPPAVPTVAVDAEADIARSDRGGVIESITSEYGPGLLGNHLIANTAKTPWKARKPVTFPQEIVLSFIYRQPALVSAVALTAAKDAKAAPKEVEVWTSLQAPQQGFQKVAAQTLAPSPVEQTVSFPPVSARFVKIRILSGYKPDALEIARVRVIEEQRAGYTPLAERNLDMSDWAKSPRRAAQTGIEWLQTSAADWQKRHKCFGCHTQAQVIMGLAVSQRNSYVVSDACMKSLSDFTLARQNKDGSFHNGQYITATQYAAMAASYWDVASRAKSPALAKAVNYLLAKQKPTGEVPADHNEPPIDQGSLMTTANSAQALLQAYHETGKVSYKKAANKALAWIARAKPVSTQDEAFQTLALTQFGTPAQQKLVGPLVARLKREQTPEGGWKETKAMKGPNGYATGQVLYAFKQAGQGTDAPEFTKGVRYLLATQQDDGYWECVNSQSRRPSRFAPTMWAVIGLAGTLPKAMQTVVTHEKAGTRVSFASAILFDFDKYNLKSEAEAALANVKKQLIDKSPRAPLVIEGHTDDVGSDAYNLGLSSRRADAVTDWLAHHGIPKTRLTSKGYGKSRPKLPNTNETNRERNRRVEILIRNPS